MDIVFSIVEILLKLAFYNDFFNYKMSQITGLRGASRYLVGVKKLNSL